MARIIEVIDIDSVGHTVRLDNGAVVTVEHAHEFRAQSVGDVMDLPPDAGPPRSVEDLRHVSQVEANIMSELIKRG